MRFDNESICLIDWLKSLPKDTTIEWTSDHFSIEHQYCRSWVDVRVPEAEKELKMNWFWTITGTEEIYYDLDLESIWRFFINFNLDIYSVYDPEPPNFCHINEIVLKKGEELTPEQEAELETALCEGPNRIRAIEGGLSPEVISSVLELWSLSYAKRSDIKFEWNPLLGFSKFVFEAKAELERILSGEDGIIDLGDGIKATDSFMDFLLSIDIDDAAKLMREIKNKFSK